MLEWLLLSLFTGISAHDPIPFKLEDSQSAYLTIISLVPQNSTKGAESAPGPIDDDARPPMSATESTAVPLRTRGPPGNPRGCDPWTEWQKVKCWWPSESLDSLPPACSYVPTIQSLPTYLKKYAAMKALERYEVIQSEYLRRGSPPKCGFCARSFECRIRNDTNYCHSKEVRSLPASCDDSSACEITKENGGCREPFFLEINHLMRYREMIHEEKYVEFVDAFMGDNDEYWMADNFERRQKRESEGFEAEMEKPEEERRHPGGPRRPMGNGNMGQAPIGHGGPAPMGPMGDRYMGQEPMGQGPRGPMRPMGDGPMPMGPRPGPRGRGPMGHSGAGPRGPMEPEFMGQMPMGPALMGHGPRGFRPAPMGHGPMGPMGDQPRGPRPVPMGPGFMPQMPMGDQAMEYGPRGPPHRMGEFMDFEGSMGYPTEDYYMRMVNKEGPRRAPQGPWRRAPNPMRGPTGPMGYMEEQMGPGGPAPMGQMPPRPVRYGPWGIRPAGPMGPGGMNDGPMRPPGAGQRGLMGPMEAQFMGQMPMGPAPMGHGPMRPPFMGPRWTGPMGYGSDDSDMDESEQGPMIFRSQRPFGQMGPGMYNETAENGFARGPFRGFEQPRMRFPVPPRGPWGTKPRTQRRRPFGPERMEERKHFMAELIHGTTCVSAGAKCLCCCGHFIPNVDTGKCENILEMIPGIGKVMESMEKEENIKSEETARVEESPAPTEMEQTTPQSAPRFNVDKQEKRKMRRLLGKKRVTVDKNSEY